MELWIFIGVMIVLAIILKLVIKSTAKFIAVLIIVGLLAYFGFFILPSFVGNILTINTYQ